MSRSPFGVTPGKLDSFFRKAIASIQSLYYNLPEGESLPIVNNEIATSFHSLFPGADDTVAALLDALKTDFENGLGTEVRKATRRAIFGDNVVVQPKPREMSDEEFEMFCETQKFFVPAIRLGKEILLRLDDVLVGDICQIETGTKICADGILLISTDVFVDESSISGETVEVPKSSAPESDFLVRRGSVCVDGSGKMLVLRVGARTQYARLLAEMHSGGGDCCVVS